MEVTQTILLDTGMLSPDLATPPGQTKPCTGSSGVVRNGLSYLDSLLTPPTSSDSVRHQCKSVEDPDYVYIPVDCDIDSLHDWRSKERPDGRRGAKVRVNNTDIAVFKFGEKVIATQAKCPHAGGPLYSGEIEELPDRSLCVKCPWHKWSFCVTSRNITRRRLFSGSEGVSRHGECVWPPGRGELGLKIFPTVVKNRKSIKIGFEKVNNQTLLGESF